jgi:cold shock CspA family protein
MTKRPVVVGTLIKWHPDRGFGIARRDHGEDVFVSAKDVRYSGLNEDDLQVGMQLSFVPFPDEKPGRADRAIYIRIISEAPA